jgi:hypothetical protein
MRSYYHTNIYWSKSRSPAWAKFYGFGKRALVVCLVVVSECLMEFAEDTGAGPRLQEVPLVPGVVTGTVSGARAATFAPVGGRLDNVLPMRLIVPQFRPFCRDQ